MKNKYNIISLFSGGGFLDIGFMQEGFNVQEAFELDKEFIKGYNFGIKTLINNDDYNQLKDFHTPILNPTDLSNAGTQKIIGEKYFGVTGVIGGPPCQDFSVGGSNKGIVGERGKLIFAYSEIIKLTKPEFLFFENVEGLIKTKDHNIAFKSLLQKLKDYGYTVWYRILNSLEFGVPQDRPRIALVGIRNDLIIQLENAGFSKELGQTNSIFSFPAPIFNSPKNKHWPKKWKFQSLEIEHEPESISEQYQQLCAFTAFQGLDNTVPNQEEYFLPKSDKFSFIEEGDTNRKSFKRLHRFRYSPTVAYGNNEVHLHPTLPRRLSVREALRLQTVPDAYILPSKLSLSKKFKLIGNGVPVKNAILIAKSIKNTLDLYYAILQKESKSINRG
jgi:DNA (cytosine-5)-methyltransferase 1